jgi:tetratricopeptide (TPR) repeat protein
MDLTAKKQSALAKLAGSILFALPLLSGINFPSLTLLAAPQSGQPSAKERRILQIQELMQQGSLGEARGLLAQAAREFPADPGFDNLLGIIEAQEKNFQAAEAAFRRAVTRAPNFIGAHLNLGRLYQENATADPEALTKALQAYRKVLQYQPDNDEANYQSAVLLQLRGDYRESLERMSQLPEDVRGSAQALSVLCADYAGLGDRSKADEAADLLRKHPGFSEADVSPILTALANAQRNDLAVRLIEGLVEQGRGSPEILHQLGLLYERQGQLDRSRWALEKSMVKDRPLTGGLVDLARVAHKQRDYQGALGYLAHARDLDPQNARIHYFFGMVCVEMNLGAEAHAAIGKAVSLEPENPEYNFAMGFVSSHRHHPEEAVPYLEKYLRISPRAPRGELMLGIAYFRSRNFADARQALLAAVKNRETAAPAHYYLGSIARQENKIDEAVSALELSLNLKPDYVDALAELGQCRIQQRNYESAEKLLRQALEINPDHYTANFNLLTLYSRTKDPRAVKQNEKFEEIKKRREEKAQDFLRGIEFRPYDERK